MIRRILPLLLVAMSIATTACASGGFYPYATSVRNGDERVYTRGYDEGRRRGEIDARQNRRFDYARHRGYRDARTIFRQGFVAGYNDGFRRSSRPGYGYPSATYPGTYPPPVYRGDRIVSPAAQNGYRDGYEQGRDDARDRDRYDPIRAARYREGDRGFSGRFGSREDYKREYRAAFQQGYEQGYRR